MNKLIMWYLFFFLVIALWLTGHDLTNIALAIMYHAYLTMNKEKP